MSSRRELLLAMGSVFISPVVSASSNDGIAALMKFVASAQSARGEFLQQIFDADGKPIEGASYGTFSFLRPGCFIWKIVKPYEQLIVSDAKTLWLYDPELVQVTVKKLTAAVSATPAAILFGRSDVNTVFNLVNQKSSDGLIWVKAVPKGADMTFASLRIGFDASGCISRMVLLDHFSQTTDMTFKNVSLNNPISRDEFKFVPPKGADVFIDEMTKG